MYKYICNYPSDREMGWSHELQGVCHDESNWFFTQNGNIWKFPLSHDINATCKSENRAKGIYKKKYGYLLGDFDYSNGFLFIPVTGDGKPYIAVFKASDLSYVAKTRIKKFGTDFSSLHWCAINPTDQCLYTSDQNVGNDFTENTSPVMVYSIDWNRIGRSQDNFLTQKTFITLYNNSGERLTREHVQGGCFDLSNHLHINNGEYTLKTINHNYANDKGGISVFYIPPIPSSGAAPYYRVKRIAYSNQSSGFRYQFNGTGEEPSGITYWDLTNKKVGGKVRGCLHAIMSDNAGIGDDDFYFKHYERTSVTNRIMSSNFSKMGVIITALKSEPSYPMRYDENRRRRKNQELVSGLYNNRRIDYTIIENMPLSGVKAILDAIYFRALDSSTNYIYINCHGSTSELALAYSLTDSSEVRISYRDLRNNVFSKIRGKRVILIDSCHSGGATDLKDANSYILCSTKESDNAYGDSVLGNYATRYWVCGAGYDFLPGAAHDMEADKNKDNKVTLKELCDYTNKKIIQSCIMISDKPNMVIFEK